MVHRHDEKCSSREQGRKKGGSEVVTEEVTHTSSQSRQMGVNRQQQHSVGMRLRVIPTHVLYAREQTGLSAWCKQGRVCVWDKIK